MMGRRHNRLGLDFQWLDTGPKPRPSIPEWAWKASKFIELFRRSQGTAWGKESNYSERSFILSGLKLWVRTEQGACRSHRRGSYTSLT